MVKKEFDKTNHQSAIIKRLFSNASSVGLKNGMTFVQRKEENLKTKSVIHLQRTFNQILQFHSF